MAIMRAGWFVFRNETSSYLRNKFDVACLPAAATTGALEGVVAIATNCDRYLANAVDSGVDNDIKKQC